MNFDERLENDNFEAYRRRDNRVTKRTSNGFDNLGIIPSFMRGINKLNLKNPTPIQKESIPVGINGDDIIAIAKTGSGKTLAYGIPMLQRLSQSKKGIGLVIVPTRELALQVEEALREFSRLIHIRSAVLIGGASLSMQRNALKRYPRLIIATPGRLMDHMERKTVKLDNVEVFILDEADRMLDMGFIPDIKKIMISIPDDRQTMLYSATMPREIEAIARKIMTNPERIEIDRSGTTPAEVSHEMFFIDNRDKCRLLAVQLHQCTGPVLVFTRTKRMASRLTVKVKNMGFSAAEIHSDRSLGQRRQAMEGFKRGRYQILIATDIAARGIDVSGIELVVNYDMPANSEDYVHRIGRTGRAGKIGHAISYATTAQRSSIRSIERYMKTKMPITALPFLPSEKLLINKGFQLDHDEKPTEQKRPARRAAIKKDAPKYKFGKKGDSRKTAEVRTESRQDDIKDKNSRRKELKSRKVKSKKTSKTDSNSENSFWANFKKKRPSKKKSVGQGSKRKKRARRK